MSIKIITVKCPQCNASVDIEEGRTQAYCTYCGSKLTINNENEHIYRHIDEAKLKQAETDRLVKLKQIEWEEKKQAAEEKTKALKIKISIILGVAGIITLSLYHFFHIGVLFYFGWCSLLVVAYIWVLSIKKEDDLPVDKTYINPKVIVPSSIEDYEKMSYVTVKANLKNAGFTNIQCIPLDDLTTGWLKKPDTVASITINGHKITTGGGEFLRNSPVVISYHSFNGNIYN